MNIQLINEPNNKFSAVEQILYNRGLSEKQILEYTNLSKLNIESYLQLGTDILNDIYDEIINAATKKLSVFLPIDCDCDGYCAAAIFLNFFHNFYPEWVENINWYVHDSKQHGLKDCIDEAQKYDMVICLDSSSNDYDEHILLHNKNIPVIIMDHHLADVDPFNYTYARILNNQLSDYSNKEMCGAGITWQFCRYFDERQGTHYSENLIDLVALANTADMMSLLNTETKYLITEGFAKANIHNPFIEYMLDKNSFPLSKGDYLSADPYQACTPMGAAFFIIPFVNATTRSGTIDEKKLIFKSMLEYEAFKKIPEIKRNKLTGKEELLVLQAVRTIGNIKNRQSKAEDAGLSMLTKVIEEKDMLNAHNILLFVLLPDEIEAEIRGLIANKFMSKYQRPCIIVSYGEKECCGSIRGYTKNGLVSFKQLLEKCRGVNWVQGHDNAAGISIETDKIREFYADIDAAMIPYTKGPIYRVDYYFKNRSQINNQIIIDIANMNDYWGQDVDRAYIGVRFRITNSNFSVMASNTLKIDLGNGLSIIKFGGTEKDIDNFTTQGWIEVEAYCKCGINSWNGNTYPQLILEEYEITDSCKYNF